jgi:hypothetical protein
MVVCVRESCCVCVCIWENDGVCMRRFFFLTAFLLLRERAERKRERERERENVCMHVCMCGQISRKSSVFERERERER